MKSKLNIIISLLSIFLVSSVNAFGEDSFEQKLKKDNKWVSQQLKDNSFSKNESFFEDAAGNGNGASAFLLFCYYSVGYYKNELVPTFYFTTINSKLLNYKIIRIPEGCKENSRFKDLKESFNKGLEYLKLAVELKYPEAKEFYSLFQQVEETKIENIIERFIVLQRALYSENPEDQLWCARMWMDMGEEERYSYWLNKAVNNKKWNLPANVELAHFLLEKGERDKACEIIKNVEKKTKYTTHIKANKTYEDVMIDMFHAVDCIYNKSLDRAAEICGYVTWDYSNYLRKDTKNLSPLSKMEYAIHYFLPKYRRKLFNAISSINISPDSLVLYKRGERYEHWKDSVQALKHYKESAIKGYQNGVKKTFHYLNQGIKCSDEDIVSLIGYVKNESTKVNWETAYLMGPFFYNNEKFRDYDFAVNCFNFCYNKIQGCSREMTDAIKGDCARYLFKCYTFGRGVEENQELADKWLSLSQKHGDIDSGKIHDILFPHEEFKYEN